MQDIHSLGERAVAAKYLLQQMKETEKNDILQKVADALIHNADVILEANDADIKQAQKNNMHSGLVDRLRLSKERITDMAEGIRQVSVLKDPIGEVLNTTELENGLVICKKRVPLGVIGIIYESRPNVTADAFSLCFKAGNAVILKGGSDALTSNLAITNVIRNTLASEGITPDAIQLITSTDRAVTNKLMKMKEYVDVLIPRGGAGLIKSVVENSTVPVIETGTGNCHIYVDEFTDMEKAIHIIINAKTQRIGVCNACESLLIHESILAEFLPRLAKELEEYHVEIRGDKKVCEILGSAVPATEEDYGTEYLDYIISIKSVSGVEEAITHINKYNTKHSDAILTDSKDNMEKFLNEVDSACVYANASTRFTDGFEFGFGAEIGISTQKLHARGPMGLNELTSYKYTIQGNGQIRP